MNSSPANIRPKDYFLSIIHALLALTSITAALTHLGNAFSPGAPYLPLVLRILLMSFGAFSVASLVFPRALRATYFGVFGVLMLLNAVSDFSHWGWLSSLRISYALEFLAFTLCVIGLGVHLALSLAHNHGAAA